MCEKYIWLENSIINIQFPYSDGLKKRVKEIPLRQWDSVHEVWFFPPHRLVAKKIVMFGEEQNFLISPEVYAIALGNGEPVVMDRSVLYPYQKEAVDFIHDNQGTCLLAEEMGLGKSVESLWYAKEKGDKVKKILIVCPANVTYKWGIEVDKWYGKEWAVISKVKQDIPDVPVLIMSYTIMQKRALDLTDVPFDLVVFDECHYLTNGNALRSKAARRVVATRMLFLSGTPFLNRPVELFNILNMINPIEWENYWAYTGRYCDRKQKWIGKGRKIWDVSGASNLDELRRRLEPIMLRRTKTEVLKDLPELTRAVLPLDMDGRREYNRVMQELKDAVKITQNLKSSEVLTRLTALRQVVGMAKVKSAVELAQNVLADPAKKVVLYAHHKMVVEKLVEELKEYGVGTIVGEDGQQTRADTVAKFQDKQFPRVIVMSSAGAEGIDLYRASDLIFVEQEWNPGRMAQAEGRLHRIGQKNAVTAHYLVLRNTLDERVHELIEAKRDVFGTVFGDLDLEEVLE